MSWKAPVYVVSAKGNLLEQIRPAFRQVMDGMPPLNADAHICIKPNICLMKKANTDVTTDPNLVEAIVDLLMERGNYRISIVESDASTNLINPAFKALGWSRLADEKQVELVNLTNSEKIRIEINGQHLKTIKIPRIMYECNLHISVPKLKVHELTGITGALKNTFGCIPFRRKAKYHKHISEVIADINSVLKPDIVVMDAICGLIGGCITGIPLRTNMIMASNDPVAIDSAAARHVGYRPRKIQHIRLSEDAGVGTMRFILEGDRNAFVPRKLATTTMIDRLTSMFLSMTERGAS